MFFNHKEIMIYWCSIIFVNYTVCGHDLFFFNIWSRDEQGGTTFQSNVSRLFTRFKKKKKEGEMEHNSSIC